MNSYWKLCAELAQGKILAKNKNETNSNRQPSIGE